MGKAKVRYAAFDLEDHAVSNNAKISSKSSKGSASKSWGQSKGSFQPTHKGKGQNSKLHPHVTSIEFDGSNDILTLDSGQAFANDEAWMFVFAFVDLDTSQNNGLLQFSNTVGSGKSAVTSTGGLYIASGGAGIVWKAASTSKARSTATDDTTNSSTSYTFGSDVEVLILYYDGSNNYHKYYNIDGDLIGQSITNLEFSQEATVNSIGVSRAGAASYFLNAELLDFRMYTGSDMPPVTTASLQAIGNRYKVFKD